VSRHTTAGLVFGPAEHDERLAVGAQSVAVLCDLVRERPQLAGVAGQVMHELVFEPTRSWGNGSAERIAARVLAESTWDDPPEGARVAADLATSAAFALSHEATPGRAALRALVRGALVGVPLELPDSRHSRLLASSVVRAWGHWFWRGQFVGELRVDGGWTLTGYDQHEDRRTLGYALHPSTGESTGDALPTLKSLRSWCETHAVILVGL
jgi:hypothetical protein